MNIIILNKTLEWKNVYQHEENSESNDVGDHAAQADLERPKQLVRGHQVGGARETEHVSKGKQDIRNDLRVIHLPFETCLKRYISKF